MTQTTTATPDEMIAWLNIYLGSENQNFSLDLDDFYDHMGDFIRPIMEFINEHK